MANEIYKSATNTKENLDGYEDTQEVYFTPVENRASRIKNTKVVVTNVVSSIGIHLDRINLDGVLDNPLLGLDAEPEDTGEGSVLCPENTLLETFQIQDDLNLGLSTATYSIGKITFQDAEQIVSTEVAKDLSRYIKSVTIKGNNENLRYFLGVGDGFTEVANQGKIFVSNDLISRKSECFYMVQNTSGSEQELTKVICSYEFW